MIAHHISQFEQPTSHAGSCNLNEPRIHPTPVFQFCSLS